MRNIHTDHESWARRAPIACLLFVTAAALYAATMAPGTIFGDPSEYQFIPAIWGIAHPPGYAFYTLLAGVWQRIVRVGSVAYRTNLLAGCVGTWTVTRVFLMARDLADATATRRVWRGWTTAAGLVAGLAVAASPDLWQHSIHANAHILSAAITATQLWVLVRWDREQQTGWLLALAFLVGIGVTHHPMTVWGIPAYGLFILLRRPRALLDVKTLIGGLMSGLLGLLPWLYFPLRSPAVPFGPTDMATWDGFLRHATAQGLRVNLFHFGLADQPDRLQVFVSLLQLQYGWLLMTLILLGFVGLAVRRPRLALLWGGFLVGHLGFTMNSVQDVMAYLLHTFVALGVLLGIGASVTVAAVARRGQGWARGVIVALLLVVVIRGARIFPRISLRDWQDADAFVAALQAEFAGQGEGAAFVSDWEHLTPFYYHTLVEGTAFEEADLRPIYVTGATPWVESVFGSLAQGPVYLSNYRSDVRDLGFRLRPRAMHAPGEANPGSGALVWRVLEPPAEEVPTPEVVLTDTWVGDELQVLGVDMPVTTATQGDAFPLVIYARVTVTQTEILMPLAHLGEVEQRWTTDSRRLTPAWQPGEWVAERYDVFVPYDLEPGSYELSLAYEQVTGERRRLSFSDGTDALSLGTVTVRAAPGTAQTARIVARSLTNVGNEVALRSAWARAGWAMRRGDWQEPLRVRAGSAVHLDLTWEVLAQPRSSYTVFLHLIDDQGRLVLGHDYTPLGGAFPSYLWFPKWLPGQRVADPYRLVLPEAVPAGTYWLEVGMYEMGSIRRVPQLSSDGTMTGDRHILGPVQVGP